MVVVRGREVGRRESRAGKSSVASGPLIHGDGSAARTRSSLFISRQVLLRGFLETLEVLDTKILVGRDVPFSLLTISVILNLPFDHSSKH